jgi:hypothetical protein
MGLEGDDAQVRASPPRQVDHGLVPQMNAVEVPDGGRGAPGPGRDGVAVA